MTRDLLFELGCEELPPKALKDLALALERGVVEGLKQASLKYGSTKWYATPRRLALWIENLAERQPDKSIERRGPAVQAAFDASGQPTQAALGFARSCRVEIEQLQRLKTDKGEWLAYTLTESGRPTTELIPDIVETALKKLPIPKRMRWGSRETSFIRPVHWVVLLFGGEIIPCEILGIPAGHTTHGHRFHAPDPIQLKDASKEEYEERLEQGRVIADFEKRCKSLLVDVALEAEQKGGELYSTELCEEVTSITEWPVPVSGSFDRRFLDLPKEVLIAEMQQHQRCFPVTQGNGNLLPFFITVSNIDSNNPEAVRKGNERVIRARLSDAEFFWEQDRRYPLENHFDALDAVLFEASLGSMQDKALRIQALARQIAQQLGGEADKTERAARLCKCDLLTEMVGEFPELQGLMGRYYAEHDGEDPEVSQAIEQHYWPRHAGDLLPENQPAQCVALADRIDTLVGIFGIGLKPSGEKDPYALRRASLGILRICIEEVLDLDLGAIIDFARDQYGDKLTNCDPEEILDYVYDRLPGYYAEQNIPKDAILAALSSDKNRPLDIHERIQAIQDFRTLPEAGQLIAGNKRIHNILKKVEGNLPEDVNPNLFEESCERELYDRVCLLSNAETVDNYFQRMEQLATLQQPIDTFFDQVMVMTDEQALRKNRIALLNQTHGLFMQIADLSKLQ